MSEQHAHVAPVGDLARDTCDLSSQLPGRHQHERLHVAASFVRRFDDRHDEGQGFARACTCLADHVTACEHCGQRGGLDGGRVGHRHRGECGARLRPQGKF